MLADVLYTLSNARFQEFVADPAMTRQAAEELARRDLTLVVEMLRAGGWPRDVDGVAPQRSGRQHTME
jgi:hypothetical protein